ncbi:Undecaprenyl-phosphate galactose phosphotransferase [Thermobaculum terrenum ATCC BAA-798]|uniref:Undecaprenyl-phosphate galactose phosphotransferase n=1 Tax=Thermobaculum terrenum (strain ATCC BAA-798 / CCMEE 7001 / YNP1) TaxID=525904 RepID=D1CIX9_THET1|nr:sugar transferase [Thermobaculum terrenum]ACZ43699.1 Undecaprenyl-phosphate galactose phosphotransferase [Thermobaculum terrenum ATCC BAA-798]
MQEALELPLLERSDLRLYAICKRALDLVGAVLMLVLLSPVMFICAVLIKLDSPGPVLFRQQRVGQGGRLFTCLKFRTMYVDADQSLHKQYVLALMAAEGDDSLRDEHGLYKLPNDPRVTRIGRWLRRTSLDELPQLWNVLRGEMSLVGPRPPIPYEVEQYKPEQLGRLTVKPGITGLWQVKGRNRTTFEQMVALDLEYVRRRGLMLDLWILLMTLPVVLLARDCR